VSRRLVVALDQARDAAEVGGKAAALAELRAASVPAPDGVVVSTAAYRAFVAHRGLKESIALELVRRPLADLRHEETWDVALRIRALFMAASWPQALRAALREDLAPLAAAGPVVVRSSAPHEDSREASFAGLHESLIGVRGPDEVLEAVRSVWASLFTDRALLYHAEVGLDPARSAMAVLVQPLVEAERAGVAFTRSPSDARHTAVEAVWGLGEGLVSGRIEPDTWLLRRDSGRVVSHRAAERVRTLRLGARGPAEYELESALRERPPLSDEEVTGVWRAAMGAERLFGTPVDCEWVMGERALVVTQARPIVRAPADERAAYLETQYDPRDLEVLGADIEHRLLPAMRDEAARMASVDLGALSDEALAAEASGRAAAVERWRAEYRTAMIPFSHGARLLGRLYTDVLRPADPFEYLTLLVRSAEEYQAHLALLRELGSKAELAPPDDSRRAAAEEQFLGAFEEPHEREEALAVLRLARTSWRLRDDDNLYLALVEREAARARQEIRRRTDGGPHPRLDSALQEILALDARAIDSNAPQALVEGDVRPRQLLGQPAGPGVGTGPARVIRSAQDLLRVRPGDVVVADALEPETAAYAARAAGIVERRGGMLVHGAIVAREHGVACVTGVRDATALIREGERLTVDGFLGIVVLDEV
jgi:phosphohistidine swiveling domain-containing protein